MERKSSSASENVNIYGAHTSTARTGTITRYIHPPIPPPTRLQEEEEHRDITSSRRLQHILSPQPSTALQKLPPPPLPLPPPHSLSRALHRSATLSGPPPYLLLLLLLRRRRRRCWRLLVFHKAGSCVLSCRVSTEERRRRRILRVIGRPQAWRVWTRERHQRASKATTT
jgi:hypothetical protein